MVTVVDVGANHVSCYVSDRAEELSWAPEASFPEVFSQPGVLTKEPISALSLKQVESARDAHLRRKSDKHVHVVRLNVQLKDVHSMFAGNLSEECLTVFADDRKLERIHRILRFPHEVKRVLSYATVVANQSFHFSPVRADIEPAHTNQLHSGECAYYAAHSPIKERRIRR